MLACMCQTATESKHRYRPLLTQVYRPSSFHRMPNYMQRGRQQYQVPSLLLTTTTVGAHAILVTGTSRGYAPSPCITALEPRLGHTQDWSCERGRRICWSAVLDGTHARLPPPLPLGSTIGSAHTECRPKPRMARATTARTRSGNNSNNNNTTTLVATATCRSRSRSGGRC